MNDHEKVEWIESGQAQWDMACRMAKRKGCSIQEMMDFVLPFWRELDGLLAEMEGDEDAWV